MGAIYLYPQTTIEIGIIFIPKLQKHICIIWALQDLEDLRIGYKNKTHEPLKIQIVCSLWKIYNYIATNNPYILLWVANW